VGVTIEKTDRRMWYADVWQCVMNRYKVRENIKLFRERLSREVNPETRALLQKLLLEEEDKLGADLEALADVQQHIADGSRRIEKQRALVGIMERDGHKGLDHAKALLNGLLEAQFLHKYYHKRILLKISNNQL
jgi:hypothetical protein